MPAPRLLAAALCAAALALAGCTRMPPPAEPVAPAPVFPVVGDSGEVLASIPDPPVRPRTAAPQQEAEPDSGFSPSDTLVTAADSAEIAADTAAVAPRPVPATPDTLAAPPAPAREEAPPAPATPTPSTPASPAPQWAVQVFAGSSRAVAFTQAQKALHDLALSDEDVGLAQEGRMWKVRLRGGDRAAAETLLERARRYFPKAFLVASPKETAR